MEWSINGEPVPMVVVTQKTMRALGMWASNAACGATSVLVARGMTNGQAEKAVEAAVEKALRDLTR